MDGFAIPISLQKDISSTPSASSIKNTSQENLLLRRELPKIQELNHEDTLLGRTHVQ